MPDVIRPTTPMERADTTNATTKKIISLAVSTR
jgi:hypothetical protein